MLKASFLGLLCVYTVEMTKAQVLVISWYLTGIMIFAARFLGKQKLGPNTYVVPRDDGLVPLLVRTIAK